MAAARQPNRPAPDANSRRGARYPLILDKLILRDFAMYLGMILLSFLLLTLVFTFFELLGDILRNRIPMLMVGEYLLNVSPSMIYIMTPLSVLLAVLTTLGLLQKTNEITAMKATGNQHLSRHLPHLRHRRRHQYQPLLLRPTLHPRRQPAPGNPAQRNQGQARANLPAP